MPDLDEARPKDFDAVVFSLAASMARMPPGPLAQLRRAEPGNGTAAFWRVYFAHKLDQRSGEPVDWEWVISAFASLTPTGNDPEKRSVHQGSIPLGKALFDNKVSELRIAKILNSARPQRRETLMRLVRILAQKNARFNLTDLANLLLFADDEQAGLRRLAQHYYAAEAAAKKEGSDA